MRDHTKLKAFELADEVVVQIYQITAGQDWELIEPKIVETEKVLNGLIRALRDDWFPLVFSLQS
jgi:hypothetical protein